MKANQGQRGLGRSQGKLPAQIIIVAALLLVSGPQVRATRVATSPDTLQTTLDNGLRVIVVRNALAPVVTTVINYLVGSEEVPAGFPGTAHAQEHMMFRGSPDLTADQLADIVAAMGGVFNADTQQTVTQYFFTVPAEDLDVALRIEMIRMRGILDDDKLWQEEKGAIEQEVAQDLSSPEYVFYTQLLAALFQGTPYAYSPLGTVESFDKTTGVMLKEFHDTWYVPNNAILVIVGAVRPEEALDRVRELFGPIPAKKIPEKPAIQLEPVQPQTLNLKTDQPFGMAVVCFRMPGYDSNEYAASAVLSDVLSSQRGDLYALVPQGKALTAGFSLDTLPKAGLGYAVAAFPQGADPQPLLDEVRKILAEDVKKGFSSDLVQAAKRQRLTQAELQKNSVSGLAMAWSQAVAVQGRRSPDDDVQAIQRVTVDEVNRLARRRLDLDHAIVAVLTPEPSGKPVAAKPPSAVESFTPKHAKPVALPDWAAQALRRLEVPESTLRPVVSTLPNGLRLIVQPEDISKTVSVYGHVRNEPSLETPQSQEGVDQVLDQLFAYGTTSLDRLAFQAALDEIGASESAGTDFSLDVLAEHFDRGVRLLADNELRPALPEEAFKIVQQQVADTVAGQLQSPGYLKGRALKESLFPRNDPALRQATPETVKSLSLSDVNDYYRKVFRPDLTTIVVIGRTTPQAAARVVGRYFSGWQATGPKPDVLLPPVPANKSAVLVVPDARRVQDSVTLAETLGTGPQTQSGAFGVPLTRSNPDYYALQLGNHVLGGGFYASRLFQDLRETSGLVYSVSSEFDVKRTRGVYGVEYACDPSNVAKARQIVVQNLQRMQTEPVADRDLQRARALALREIPLSEASIDDIAQGFLRRVELDLPLDEPTRAARQYLKLTADEVQAAFEKYLRPEDFVQVTQGPEPK